MIARARMPEVTGDSVGAAVMMILLFAVPRFAPEKVSDAPFPPNAAEAKVRLAAPAPA